MFKFTYTNKKKVKINIIIDNGNIEITKEIIQAFIQQLETDKIIILEDLCTGELYACDNYIYNTNYSFHNLKFNCTYGENDKILECDITFMIEKQEQIHYFDKNSYNYTSLILKSI